jgi:class 3 adenylate cyclase
MLRSARASQKGSSKSVTSAGHRRRSTASGEAIIPETFDITFKAISSFVPTKLLKNLAEDGTIMRPHSTTTHGICLLADISGFTRLSGAYCARGKDGLDGLQNATSGYMGSLVNTVYSYGGDVIKFAGDALVCIFEPPNLTRSSLERCCASALQCAWVLKEFSTAELTLHVGISCGDICFGQLGGFENKWECLISGTCISQLSQCLDDAPSKHVAITKECHECLVSSQLKLVTCEATALKSGNYLIHSVVVISSCNDQSFVRQVTDDTLFLSQTACYVPRPVTQSLMAGSFAFLAELREVTTVFIKFDGYSDSRYKDLLSLQRFFYACQEILSDSGGFMRQFLVDDKGCVLIALWGVPTATFHDDCRRALGASVRIRSKLLDMKMSCSSGITTGVVYCGTVGNELRREYAAVGDVVNLAARLMSKANGEILLDENTYSRLPESVHRKLTRQPLMAVKGKDKPIVSYQFDSTRTVQDDGRFGASLVNSSLDEELPIRQICKDAFMGPLTSLLSDAPAKEIQFLVLEGRLGTGREGSVSWLHRWCNTRNLRLVSVRLTKANSIEDYRAVAKIFRNMMGEENFDDIDRQSFVVNSLLKQMYPKDMETREKVAYPTMRHALAVVCPLNQAFNRRASSTDSCSPVIDRDRDKEAYCSSRKSSKNEGTITFSEKFEANIPSSMMLASLKDIFSLLFAEQPMVLIIEDAHEMDEPSWKVILSLLKMQMKAFIVLTQEPISYLMSLFNAAGSETPIGELINPEAVMTYDWVDTYVNRLTDYKKSSYILLPELTFNEVRAHVANTLKVSAKDLPEGLDQMAFDLSGGNPFWVEEISTFLRTYGVQEFISSLEVKGDSNIKNCIVSSLQFGRTRRLLESRSSVSLDKADSVTTPEVYSADCRSTSKSMQGSSSKLFNLLGTIKSGSKLEFLVVCRFAKLSMDEQSTARTASIIGTTFTADVLLSALPIQLGAYLTAILQSLIENHWLKSKTEVNAGGTIKVEYSFTHPLMHKTLYDLTPSSIKRALHLSIAKVPLLLSLTALISHFRVLMTPAHPPLILLFVSSFSSFRLAASSSFSLPSPTSYPPPSPPFSLPPYLYRYLTLSISPFFSPFSSSLSFSLSPSPPLTFSLQYIEGMYFEDKSYFMSLGYRTFHQCCYLY